VDKPGRKRGAFMKMEGLFNKFAFFIIGAGVAIAFLFLIGAASVPQIGRYQIGAVSRGNYSDVYVIDTTTGAVKWWDSKNENIPFEQIKIKKGFFD
jgi:hypothetical protein